MSSKSPIAKTEPSFEMAFLVNDYKNYIENRPDEYWEYDSDIQEDMANSMEKLSVKIAFGVSDREIFDNLLRHYAELKYKEMSLDHDSSLYKTIRVQAIGNVSSAADENEIEEEIINFFKWSLATGIKNYNCGDLIKKMEKVRE